MQPVTFQPTKANIEKVLRKHGFVMASGKSPHYDNEGFIVIIEPSVFDPWKNLDKGIQRASIGYVFPGGTRTISQEEHAVRMMKTAYTDLAHEFAIDGYFIMSYTVNPEEFYKAIRQYQRDTLDASNMAFDDWMSSNDGNKRIKGIIYNHMYEAVKIMRQRVENLIPSIEE